MKSALKKKKKVYFGLHGFAYDNYFLSQMEITGGPLLDTYIVAAHSTAITSSQGILWCKETEE